MKNQSIFSNVTQNYLSEFYCILDNMIDGMTEAELTDSISHNFIVQMIPHHEAAIEMSHNILKYTTNVPLQNIALQIVDEQTKSIENMLKIKEMCSCSVNTQQELCMYQQKMDDIMQNMFMKMNQACSTNDINGNFIREMIPHHMGAVEMSCVTLKYPICSELVPILQAIITSQKRGIMQMQRLLRCMC